MQVKNLNNLEQRNDVYEGKTISKIFESGKDYKEAKQIVDMNLRINQWLAAVDDTDRGRIEMAEEKNKLIKEGIKQGREEGEEINKQKIAKKMLQKKK